MNLEGHSTFGFFSLINDLNQNQCRTENVIIYTQTHYVKLLYPERFPAFCDRFTRKYRANLGLSIADPDSVWTFGINLRTQNVS